jgi:hypothetical protein
MALALFLHLVRFSQTASVAQIGIAEALPAKAYDSPKAGNVYESNSYSLRSHLVMLCDREPVQVRLKGLCFVAV